MAMISKEKTKSAIGAIALKIMGWQLLANIILWVLFSEFRKYQINRNFSDIKKYIVGDNIDLILVKESFKIEKRFTTYTVCPIFIDHFFNKFTGVVGVAYAQ